MFDPSVGPAIPHRTSARTALSPKSKQGRKRRSLPTASHRDAKRQTSNHVVVKPASTEIISSLIETLSAISSPAEHHFDSLPSIASSHSTPASPRPWQAEFSLITGPSTGAPQADSMRPPLLGSGTDSDAHVRPQGVHDDHFLHPDRSSIRGWSPRRISSDRSSEENAKEPTDLHDLRGAYSIGNLSIEPKPSTTTIDADRSGGRKSPNSFASFSSGLKASLRQSNSLVVLKPGSQGSGTGERLIIGATPPGSPGPDTLVVSKRRTHNSVAAESPNIPTRASSVQSNRSPRRLYRNSETSGEPSASKKKHSIPNEDYIPTRNSSMRHSQRLSPSRHKRGSQLSESSGGVESGKSVLERQLDMPEQALQEAPDELGEDSVNRRIKELKDQKLERERNSLETSAECSLAQETPDRTLAPSPGPVAPLPTSICALIPEQRAVEVQQPERLEDTEKGAPAPAIAQRINRKNGVRASSVEAKPATLRYASTVSTDDNNKRSSFVLPQRSNSRLLKRFSRPMSPAPAEKRRTISHSLLETKRNTSYQNDEAGLLSEAVDGYLLSSRLSQKISDPQTGRVISFSEVGDPEGSVIFCCVGMGLTRFITAFYDELASTLKLRLVTPDRPGVGGSEPRTDGLDTTLGWPDDVRAICQHLNITKFSILAHSAGAIYALATALRMPQHIRCRVHLLAPWIPPSQMCTIGAQQEPSPARSLTYSQRFLRSLPTAFLKAANSSFLSATSASVTTSLPKSPLRSKRKSFIWGGAAAPNIPEFAGDGDLEASLSPESRNSEMADFSKENRPPSRRVSTPINGRSTARIEKERRSAYDARLAEAIWDAATTGANPAVDLLVCLERRQPIGFRYVDITRSVVIHHGSKDSRVPVENVNWLGKTMRRCEVRVLEGEGHGLMASAGVMSNVLMEMAQEWSDWNRVVKGKGGMHMRATNAV